MKQIEGRVAVVTGGASGVGRATAGQLADRGCRIALVDINEDALAEVAQELEAGGATVSRHVADVSDASRMERLAAEIVDAQGAVHILVNNAGVSVSATFEDHTLDDLQWIVGINFWGVVHGCKYFLPLLREADEAHIVNISSMFGFIGVPTQSAYCATKYAVKGFSESLWAELRGTSIGVTSIHPGGIRTNIAETMRAYDEEVRSATVAGLERSRPPEVVAKAIVRAIEKNKLRAIVGWEAYAADWFKRVLPVSTHRMVGRFMP